MLSLLLFLLLQGVPVPAAQSGSITGVLTTETGKPAVGIRVSALARPESLAETFSATAMVSIAETDASGVFKLENVPPGRYYIVAGRVDQPTYYPGTLDIGAGKDVLITPGAALSGLNFMMRDNSVRPPPAFTFSPRAISWNTPIRVTMEGGARIPVFDAGLFPVLRITRISDHDVMDIPLTATFIDVPLTSTPQYRVSVEGLSSRYAVKSIVSGQSNLIADALQLPVPPPSPMTGVSLSTSIDGMTVITFSGGTIFTTTSQSALAGTTVVNGVSIPNVMLLSGQLPPVPTIVVTLAEVAPPAPRTGVTITGTVREPIRRSISISGVEGTIYADGTFELNNVAPGRHTILTKDNPPGARPLGASVVVGEQDISGIRLQQLMEVPLDLASTAVAPTTATRAPGSMVPLAGVRGHLVDENTKARFELEEPAGKITVNGNTVSYTISNVGEFEVQNLLPGRYDFELSTFEGSTYKRTIEIGDEDLTLEWPVAVPSAVR